MNIHSDARRGRGRQGFLKAGPTGLRQSAHRHLGPGPAPAYRPQSNRDRTVVTLGIGFGGRIDVRIQTQFVIRPKIADRQSALQRSIPRRTEIDIRPERTGIGAPGAIQRRVPRIGTLGPPTTREPVQILIEALALEVLRMEPHLKKQRAHQQHQPSKARTNPLSEWFEHALKLLRTVPEWTNFRLDSRPQHHRKERTS